MDAAIVDFLVRSGLNPGSEPALFTPLAGGVSSDIWRVDLPSGRRVCVKRALSRLKVAAHWEAPVSRNAYEWAWMRFVAGVLPDAVPRPLAQDEAAGLFAMEFLAPEDHPLWKHQLLQGQVDVPTAQAVGRVLGALHQASSAHAATLARDFDTTANFHALRLEPYLLETASRHPVLAARLHALVERTTTQRRALVHGDVSPKNILLGPRGPVLLDAECAWWGDPAFDLAFCLNHLLLKAVHRPDRQAALRASFGALVQAYFEAVRFEPWDALEARVASLLPALLLARVDGKSPVEYITDESAKARVRDAATPLIDTPRAELAAVADACYATLCAG